MLGYTGTLPARSTAAVGESAYIVWATSGLPVSSLPRATSRATSASWPANSSEYWL